MKSWNLHSILYGQMLRVRKKGSYFKTYLKSIPHLRDFANVECYCMFVGYPRSGSSLVGSLLDSHSNIVIAHELDAMKFIKEGFGKNQIFYLILRQSKVFT